MSEEIKPRDVRWYGWRPQLPNPFEPQFSDLKRKVLRLAPKFDQRGTPTMPPIYNQGNLGGCVGNGVTACVEQTLGIEGKNIGPMSRLMCYYNARRIEGTTSEDAGAMISDGVTGVANWGLCTEELWPYDISKFASMPPPKARNQAARHKAIKSYSVNQKSADLKQCIAEGYGVVFGFTVYDGFESDAVAKTGVLQMPKRGEQIAGGHCTVLVGWDDPSRRYIVRNSWGTDWGQLGYFLMPYDYVLNPDLSSDFKTIRLVA